MKFIYKFMISIPLFLFLMSMVNINKCCDITLHSVIKPLYDNIWGTIYHAEVKQCDNTPLVTGDGSRINPHKASEHRWIAISQEMLNNEYRLRLLNDSTSTLYRGKIEYGDTVWIESPFETINGWWVVHDAKNQKYRNSIDFLQTKGDSKLYNNDPMWCGKFKDIKIYSMNDAKKLEIN
jgi:hypothetical protein